MSGPVAKPSLPVQRRSDSATTSRTAWRIVGTIEPDELRQCAPAVNCLLHDGPAGNRCSHPRHQRIGAEQCRNEAAHYHGAQ